MRETTFHPPSHQMRASRLASLAATGTFLDHLPCTAQPASSSPTRLRTSDVGVTIQLLTLRAIDGQRALETKLGIPVVPGTDPAERFLLPGSRLVEATRESILASGPDGARLDEELFGSAGDVGPRVEISELVSLQRRWGAASNGMTPGTRTNCRIKPGVVLLGALRVRSANLTSLATLFAALDRAAAHGLPSIGHPLGACQLDVLALVGGTLDHLPSVSSIVHGQENRFWASATIAPEHASWARAPYRLEGRDARRAASQIARVSPLNFHFGLLA